MNNVITNQVSFERGATTLEYLFSYGEVQSGVVVRKGAGKNVRWEVEDKPECFGRTREEAVLKYLREHLTDVLPPLRTHRWVSVKGTSVMLYHCSFSNQVLYFTDHDAVHRYCVCCGEPIIFNQTYWEAVEYVHDGDGYVLQPKQ